VIKVKKIQKIKTLDGYMVPVYRDWDTDINDGFIPKMIYITTLKPGVVKDIILHENRKAYMTCISGNVSVETLTNDSIENYNLKFENEKDFINLIIIENNVPVRIKNLSKSSSIILNCPSPAWHPENQDTIKFKSWEEYRKWEG
jgi:hypothetical protein